MLAAVQAIVIVILLVPGSQEKSYSTLSASRTAAAGTAVEQQNINVVFLPTATESEIRELLQSIHGSLASGPSREGRYVVQLSENDNPDQAIKQNLEQVIEALKNSKIVLFAEQTI